MKRGAEDRTGGLNDRDKQTVDNRGKYIGPNGANQAGRQDIRKIDEKIERLDERIE